MTLRLVVITLFTTMVACTGAGEQKDLISSSTPTAQQKEVAPLSQSTLGELYRTAKSESERRAIALRAIDEEAIFVGASITSVDEIFGTDFRHQLPSKEERRRSGVVGFVADENTTEVEDNTSARGYGGWHLVVEFDHAGKLLRYYLTNLAKGMSSTVGTKENYSLPQLAQFYKSSTTASEQRKICLQAIDSGVIVTTGPVSVIDQIFGTQYAGKLPTKKQVERTVQVRFRGDGNPASDPSTNVSDAARKWFLAVQYDYNGDIQNYYLSNTH